MMQMIPSRMRLARAAVAAIAMAAFGAHAQQAQEEPFWAKGRPKTDTAMKMAPVPAFPIPTAADKLPIAKMKLPPGFKVEIWASRRARRARPAPGRQGHDLRQLAVRRRQDLRGAPTRAASARSKVIADKLMLPNGIEFHKGALYVATPKDITRYDNIEDKLDKPPASR